MNGREREVRQRIASLVESIRDDHVRSRELFYYVWSMICVRRGLMRVVREIRTNDGLQLVMEEVKTGNQRLVGRPNALDNELEGLAIQALARILGDISVASARRR